MEFRSKLGRLWGKRRWERLYGRSPSKDNPHVANMCACEETDLVCKRHPEIPQMKDHPLTEAEELSRADRFVHELWSEIQKAKNEEKTEAGHQADQADQASSPQGTPQ